MKKDTPLKGICDNADRVELFYNIPYLHVVDSNEQSLKTLVLFTHAKFYIRDVILKDPDLSFKDFRKNFKTTMFYVSKMSKTDQQLVSRVHELNRRFEVCKRLSSVSSENMVIILKSLLPNIKFNSSEYDKIISVLIYLKIDELDYINQITKCPILIDLLTYSYDPTLLVAAFCKHFPNTVADYTLPDFKINLEKHYPNFI